MLEQKNKLKFYEEPLFLNFLLFLFSFSFFLLKLIFSIITNSLALQADAFDNLTDVVMNITAFIGIIFAHKRPNKKFPYGYYKMENIISLFISLLIFFTAFSILIRSFSNIIDFYNGNYRIVHFSPLIFIFLIISILFSIVLMFSLKKMGKKTGSPIINSQVKEKYYDIFISISVLLSFIGVLFNFYIFDSIFGIIIVFFIVKGGYEIFLISIKTLLDAVIDFEKQTELYKLIETTPHINKIEKMALRSYGRYIILELEIILNKNFRLHQIENLKKLLIKSIQNNFPEIFKIILITHRQNLSIIKIGLPLENNKALTSRIAEHFGDAPFFVILEFKDGSLLNYEIYANKFINEEKRKGILVSEWLITKHIDKIFLKRELNKGPSIILQSEFVESEITDLESLEDIIKYESI